MTARKSKSNKKERKSELEKNSEEESLFEEKEAFSSEIDLISKILEKDIEKSGFSLIESNNQKGRPTTLNDYRIFGNEKLDGIVILQKAKKGNAVYVMNVLQLMYFLRGKENENGEHSLHKQHFPF